VHSTLTLAGARRAVAAALAGRALPEAIDDDALVDVAIAARVAALFAASPAAGKLRDGPAARLAEQVRHTALGLAVLDEELKRALSALGDAGVEAVVIKGAHLAHAVYRAPWMRPRADTDLLIPTQARAACERVLARLGYTGAVHVRGSLILGQFHVERPGPAGSRHALDLHWRLAAPLAAEQILPARRVLDAAQPLPGLGAAARGPALHDALALSCLHLAAHHWPSCDLLWLMDVRLLALALDARGGDAFVADACERRYRVLASAVLAAAQQELPHSSLLELIRRLDAANADDEGGTYLLDSQRTPARDLLFDVRHAGWRTGARLIGEHLFPDREYMRASFGARPLPVAYAARAWRGARRWIRG